MMRTRFGLISALVFCGLWLGMASAQAAEPVFPPQGGLQDYTAKDFFAHPKKQKTYTENWYYEFELDNGYHMQVNYMKTNIGVIKGVCGVQVWLMKEGQKDLSIGRELPLDAYKEDRANMQINWRKRNGIKGLPPKGHEIYFNINKGPGISANIKFGRIVKGFVPGDGVYKFNKKKDEEMGVYVAIPRARVVGTLTVGDQTIKVRGWAYHEHTYQTMLGNSFMRRRYQSRLHTNEQTVSINLFETNSTYGKFSHGWSYVATDQGVTDIFPTVNYEALNSTKVGPYSVAQGFKATGQGSKASLNVEIGSKTLLQRFSLTQDMSTMMKAVVKAIIGNPMFYRYNTTTKATITQGDQATPVEGKGFYEVMATQ